ncbi:MAG: hypothetical protein AAF098_13450 [Pseudomonadota bacterium]
MSSVLGYDHNGRQLRAGDLVVAVPTAKRPVAGAEKYLWTPFHVTGPALDGDCDRVNTDIPAPHGSFPTLKIKPDRVRRVGDKHPDPERIKRQEKRPDEEFA